MKANLFWYALAAVWLHLASSTTYASDPVVFDSGNHVNHASISSGRFHEAAAFTLSSDTEITGISWKGVYAVVPTTADNFVIRIYNSVGSGIGTPTTPPVVSAIFAQNIGSAIRVATGESFQIPSPPDSYSVYGYSASIPAFNAAAGTQYWLEIYNNFTANYWLWSMDEDIGVYDSEF